MSNYERTFQREHEREATKESLAALVARKRAELGYAGPCATASHTFVAPHVPVNPLLATLAAARRQAKIKGDRAEAPVLRRVVEAVQIAAIRGPEAFAELAKRALSALISTGDALPKHLQISEAVARGFFNPDGTMNFETPFFDFEPIRYNDTTASSAELMAIASPEGSALRRLVRIATCGKYVDETWASNDDSPRKVKSTPNMCESVLCWYCRMHQAFAIMAWLRKHGKMPNELVRCFYRHRDPRAAKTLAWKHFQKHLKPWRTVLTPLGVAVYLDPKAATWLRKHAPSAFRFESMDILDAPNAMIALVKDIGSIGNHVARLLATKNADLASDFWLTTPVQQVAGSGPWPSKKEWRDALRPEDAEPPIDTSTFRQVEHALRRLSDNQIIARSSAPFRGARLLNAHFQTTYGWTPKRRALAPASKHHLYTASAST